jgi:hypothetical protein
MQILDGEFKEVGEMNKVILAWNQELVSTC